MGFQSPFQTPWKGQLVRKCRTNNGCGGFCRAATAPDFGPFLTARRSSGCAATIVVLTKVPKSGPEPWNVWTCSKKAPTKTPTKDSDTVGVEKTGQLQRVAFGERYNEKVVGRHTAVQTVVRSPASLQPRMRLRPNVGRVTSDQRSWSRFFYERGSV